jgi:hypothetical protein
MLYIVTAAEHQHRHDSALRDREILVNAAIAARPPAPRSSSRRTRLADLVGRGIRLARTGAASAQPTANCSTACATA